MGTREACDEVPTLTPGAGAKLVLWMLRNRKAEKAAAAHGAEREDLFLNPNGEDMAQLLSWVVEGKVRPVIDNVWPFDKSKEAALRNFSGRAKGKCVVRVIE